jgi:hypothetical protein
VFADEQYFTIALYCVGVAADVVRLLRVRIVLPRHTRPTYAPTGWLHPFPGGYGSVLAAFLCALQLPACGSSYAHGWRLFLAAFRRWMWVGRDGSVAVCFLCWRVS